MMSYEPAIIGAAGSIASLKRVFTAVSLLIVGPDVSDERVPELRVRNRIPAPIAPIQRGHSLEDACNNYMRLSVAPDAAAPICE
jgi:hypothetical protein